MGGMEKQTHKHRTKQAPLLIQLPSSYSSAQGRRGPTARLVPAQTTQRRENTWPSSQFSLVMYSEKIMPIGLITPNIIG